MRCEICGKEIEGEPLKVRVEGAIMYTCRNCARFGVRVGPLHETVQRMRKSGYKQRSWLGKEEEKEIIEDYYKVIKIARERLGLTQAQLGRAINEKTSVITRLESRGLVPDNALAKKLERALKIRLFQVVED